MSEKTQKTIQLEDREFSFFIDQYKRMKVDEVSKQRKFREAQDHDQVRDLSIEPSGQID